jgi:hypothetical protein
LVPTARLELAQLSPLPPQDSVSTNFTTSAGSELSGSRGMVCACSTTVRVYPESRAVLDGPWLFSYRKEPRCSAIGAHNREGIPPSVTPQIYFAGICASPVAGGDDGTSAAGATAASEPAGICCAAGCSTAGNTLVFSSTLPELGAERKLPK